MIKYIWALDLSMACVGISIFSDDGNVIDISSIETNSGDNHQMKLKFIGKNLLKLRKKYPPKKIVIESGFTRFNRSTQVIFRCHGLVNYLFWDVEQIYYPATDVRKTVTGKGNCNKQEIHDFIVNKYNIHFENYDESDSFSVGLAHMYKEGILKP